MQLHFDAAHRASAFFSFLGVLQTWRNLWQLKQKSPKTTHHGGPSKEEAHPTRAWHWGVFYLLWGLTQLAAAAFHVLRNHNRAAEMADYFSVALLLLYHTAMGVLQVERSLAWPEGSLRLFSRVLLLLVCVTTYLHYIREMVHHFDYGCWQCLMDWSRLSQEIRGVTHQPALCEN